MLLLCTSAGVLLRCFCVGYLMSSSEWSDTEPRLPLATLFSMMFSLHMSMAQGLTACVHSWSQHHVSLCVEATLLTDSSTGSDVCRWYAALQGMRSRAEERGMQVCQLEGEQWTNGCQQDAHEFLTALLDYLQVSPLCPLAVVCCIKYSAPFTVLVSQSCSACRPTCVSLLLSCTMSAVC